MLKIEIKTGNAAYSDDGENITDEGRIELCRNLDDIKNKIEDGYDRGYVIDINGNKVGEWDLE